MDEFTSPALNVYLDGLAPSSKLAYIKKMTSFIEFCEDGTDDGPYAVTLEQIAQRFDASTSSSSVAKRCRTTCSSSTSSTNQASSLMPTISIGSGSSHININLNIGYPASVVAGSSIQEESNAI